MNGDAAPGDGADGRGDAPPAPTADEGEGRKVRSDNSLLGAICITSLAAGPIFLFTLVGHSALQGHFGGILDPAATGALLLGLFYSSVVGFFLAIVPLILGTLVMVKLSETVPAFAHPFFWGIGGFVIGGTFILAFAGLCLPLGVTACLLVTSILCALLARRLITLPGK